MDNAFEHLANLLQFPELAAQNQTAFNKVRFDEVVIANRFRPQFLPVKHVLPASAQNAPIAEITPDLSYSIIITGAITDGEDRNCNVYLNRSRKTLVGFGKEPNLKLSLDALAGHSVATAGFAGEKEFPTPLLLNEQDYLTLEIFQDTTPGSPEIVYTVFNGFRVFRPNHAEAQLSPAVAEEVRRLIALRPVPITQYDVVKVEFDSGRALAETPQDDEPYLILGFRSTFTDALVSLGFDSARSFSKDKFPIWALTSEKNNNRVPFKMLKKPLFVPPKEQVYFTLENTIDGNLYATDGNIEVLRRTV